MSSALESDDECCEHCGQKFGDNDKDSDILFHSDTRSLYRKIQKKRNRRDHEISCDDMKTESGLMEICCFESK